MFSLPFIHSLALRKYSLPFAEISTCRNGANSAKAIQTRAGLTWRGSAAGEDCQQVTEKAGSAPGQREPARYLILQIEAPKHLTVRC